ncbi:MAG: ThiF family adenylyltransferase [Nanoarchaeota archaeon]
MNQKIKLKESVYILKESEEIYQVVFTSTRRIKRFSVDHLVKELIFSAKSETNMQEVISKLGTKYPEEDIVTCLYSLEAAGIVNFYGDDKINPRHKRQISFINELTENWEETMKLQKRLEESRIAVFGIGGIGTWMVNGLNQIGIGEIRIIDPDIVSISNLNRQLFFNESDLGQYKVDVISQKLSDANIKKYYDTVSRDQPLDKIVENCNFLVNCADFPSVADTTKIIDEYATRYNIPYSVAGGYNMHLGMVGPIIVPGKTACFDCFLAYQKENDPLSNLEKIKDVEQTGSLGPIAGAIANFQVMEIFKYITGKGSVNINRFVEIDFMDFNIEWREYSKKPDCITCNLQAK